MSLEFIHSMALSYNSVRFVFLLCSFIFLKDKEITSDSNAFSQGTKDQLIRIYLKHT